MCLLGVSATADLGLGAQSSFLRRRQYLSEVAEIRPLVEAIVDEQLGPERIAAVFKLSACKTAKADCAFVLLVGSVSRYRGSPGNWSSEPEDGLCSTLVGGDFALVSDQATKFVAKHWLAISSLAHGAEAPEGGHRGDTFCLVSDLQRGESARPWPPRRSNTSPAIRANAKKSNYHCATSEPGSQAIRIRRHDLSPQTVYWLCLDALLPLWRGRYSYFSLTISQAMSVIGT